VEADTLLSEQSPAKMLIGLSESAHMVVLGSRRSGAVSHLGSTILAVAAHGRGTIVAIRENGEEITSGPVVVGVDGSPVSDTAVAAAFAEAAERETDLVAVHTWSDLTFTEFASTGLIEIPAEDLQTAEQAVLAERLAGWQQHYPEVTVQREVYPSTPAQHLREWSERAQLVVVGSRGRGGFRGLLLGSTSQSLIQHSACPVMITRPA
jgi:nucleotide-binding universal stress UspA family protein